MPSHELDEQRLAFGRVAELYERARPSYPAAAIDGLLGYAALGPGSRVLEVGAGTGKGTRLLAERGLIVTALEPDPAMSAVARRECAGLEGVRFELSAFESWEPQAPIEAVVSFQAWHWTEAGTRYERAARALGGHGSLAAIWTFPDWAPNPMRDQLCEIYANTAPGLAADFPMHPASEPTRLAGDWENELAGSPFGGAEVREYPWPARYGGQEYRALLETHQDHILLAVPQRDRLLAAVAAAVERAGGIQLDFVTRLCLARLA